MRRFGDLPFPVGAAIIAGVTVAAIALAILLRAGAYWPVAFAAPVLVSGWYLVGYSARPGPRRTSPKEEEPFEDPVEEADRVAQGQASDTLVSEESATLVEPMAQEPPALESPPPGPA